MPGHSLAQIALLALSCSLPVVLFGGPEGARLRDGLLCDLAPSLLELMGLDQPEDMTGKSLIVH